MFFEIKQIKFDCNLARHTSEEIDICMRQPQFLYGNPSYIKTYKEIVGN